MKTRKLFIDHMINYKWDTPIPCDAQYKYTHTIY